MLFSVALGKMTYEKNMKQKNLVTLSLKVTVNNNKPLNIRSIFIFLSA
jgi:hypothetical protein